MLSSRCRSSCAKKFFAAIAAGAELRKCGMVWYGIVDDGSDGALGPRSRSLALKPAAGAKRGHQIKSRSTVPYPRHNPSHVRPNHTLPLK